METAIEHRGKRPAIDEGKARGLFREAIERKVSSPVAADQQVAMRETPAGDPNALEP